VVKGLSSPARIKILKHAAPAWAAQRQSQSTIAAQIQVLEEPGLVPSELSKGLDEISIALDTKFARRKDKLIEVEMPLGLHTSCRVSRPCGLCSTEGVLGVLVVPDSFLDPARVN
jgi:predicted transcriptional regulator